MAEEETTGGGGGGGMKSFLTRKAGPLPIWAWMGLGLCGALVFSSLRGGAGGGEEDSTTGIDAADAGTAYDPYVTFVDGDTTTITNIQAPPGGGREPTPTAPAPTIPKPTVPTVPKPTVPKPTVTPKPTPAAPAGTRVTIIPYKKGQKPGTPSTLWGVAQKIYGTQNGALWQQIWNAPQNAALRAKRKKADLIQPGDSVWVPKK